MKAVEISRAGGPEVLQPTDRPLPAPRHGEVRVKVAYAGVNRPDALQRAGLYNPPPGASDLPGLEAAGEVSAIGPGVTGLFIDLGVDFPQQMIPIAIYYAVAAIMATVGVLRYRKRLVAPATA